MVLVCRLTHFSRYLVVHAHALLQVAEHAQQQAEVGVHVLPPTNSKLRHKAAHPMRASSSGGCGVRKAISRQASVGLPAMAEDA